MAERKARPTKKDNDLLEGIPAKVARVLKDDTDWITRIQQLSKAELDIEIIKSNEYLVDFRKDMEADEPLIQLKQAIKEASAVYKDGIKINEARATYCVFLKRSM
jgi:hypothetical protein